MDSDRYMTEEELYHYGVKGMRWGVIRSKHKERQNSKLIQKAYKYDAKAAKATGKSEKYHAEKDLGKSNRAAKKVKKYNVKAAKLSRKAASESSDSKQLKLTQKAETLRYKAAKQQRKSDILSKSAGYGAKAMKYSIKSDRLQTKAAKARMKIAKNESYISMMNKRMSDLSDADLNSAREYINRSK